LGQALAGAGRREEAQAVLARYQEMSKATPRKDQSPSDDPAGKAVAEANRLSAAGDSERALALVRRERELSPDELRLRLAEVRLLLELKRTPEALKGVEEILALKTGAAAAAPAGLNGLAVQLIQQGKKDEARQLLNKILALRPDDAAARANLLTLGG
ncbi:MAG: hypothetical protein ABUL63_00375, partial [Acidobacteriota bacterium]